MSGGHRFVTTKCITHKSWISTSVDFIPLRHTMATCKMCYDLDVSEVKSLYEESSDTITVYVGTSPSSKNQEV